MPFNRHYIFIFKISTSAKQILKALGSGNGDGVAEKSETHC